MLVKNITYIYITSVKENFYCAWSLTKNFQFFKIINLSIYKQIQTKTLLYVQFFFGKKNNKIGDDDDFHKNYADMNNAKLNFVIYFFIN